MEIFKKKKEWSFSFMNEWKDVIFLREMNWIIFHPILLEIDTSDRGTNITICLMGLGINIGYQEPITEEFMEDIEDIMIDHNII